VFAPYAPVAGGTVKITYVIGNVGLAPFAKGGLIQVFSDYAGEPGGGCLASGVARRQLQHGTRRLPAARDNKRAACPPKACPPAAAPPGNGNEACGVTGDRAIKLPPLAPGEVRAV
jgi:hypothetical protein